MGQGVRTAADLVSYMDAFPSAVAHLLHWPLRDVSAAKARLVAQLAGHEPAEALRSPSRRAPPLGAMDPDELDRLRRRR
jgi:hypothetical protein